jgi:hypothetical protein
MSPPACVVQSADGSWRRVVGLNSPLIDAGVFPQLAGDLDWIDAGCLPPRLLVAGAMYRAMMDRTRMQKIACIKGHFSAPDGEVKIGRGTANQFADRAAQIFSRLTNAPLVASMESG